MSGEADGGIYARGRAPCGAPRGVAGAIVAPRRAEIAPFRRATVIVSTDEPLSDIAIQRELGALRGWARRGGALTKTFTFRTFADGIAFVTRVADAAEAADHHPDIDIRHTPVTLTLSTQAAGARVTQKDVALAHSIERASTITSAKI